MQLNINDLQYLVFPGESPSEEFIQSYTETYRVWHQVWSATFDELDGNATLYSDDMCRQTHIGSLLKGNECVGIGMFHLVDFRLPTASRDSWFKAWSDDALQKLVEKGKKILVVSNITINPKFRGQSVEGIRLREIILGLCSKTFLATTADTWAGTARCNRGVDKACYNAGAQHICHGSLHGVQVAMVAAYRQQLESHAFEIPVEKLWQSRITYALEENQISNKLAA